MATEREAYRDRMNGKGDGIVRANVGITYPVWKDIGDKLGWVEGFSPYVHVGASKECSDQPYRKWTDNWGSEWVYPIACLDGACVGHPLDDWSKLASYAPPDPADYTDWAKAEEQAKAARNEGRVVRGSTDHGFLFLRMTYLRGFENFMVDAGEANPMLDDLIAVIEDYWMGVVRRWVDIGADVIVFGDDLGLQHALPISPAAWRRLIKPTYERIFSYCRQNDVYVHLHTDGYIVDIIPDLIECGVSTLNPQELVNGLDNLERLAKGKVYLDLDIDRQSVTVFGTPEEIREHVRQCITKLGSPSGGLSLIWGIYPPATEDRVEAALRAMHDYATHWAEPGRA